MSYKVIVTGATGMVGEGVLMECLAHPMISEVLSVSRKPNGIQHAKLKEYIVPEFLNIREEDQNLKGYDGCFFCAGVTSVGKKEDEYTRLTFDTTIQFAKAVLKQNPGSTFVYVSGAGTDSKENGRLMWARIKGKTENTLVSMGFKKVYNFRPGFMKATPGQKHTLKLYNYLSWLYPILKVAMPNGTSTLKQVGLAMIYCLIKSPDKQILEVQDINKIKPV